MTITNKSLSQKQSVKNLGGRLIWVSPLAMFTASVANLGLYATAGSLSPSILDWSGSGIGQIIGATIVYLFIGTIIFAIISATTSRPARNYLIIATIGLLLSLFLPISAGFGYGAPGTPPADVATVITLSLMHIMSFAISVPMFLRLTLD